MKKRAQQVGFAYQSILLHEINMLRASRADSRILQKPRNIQEATARTLAHNFLSFKGRASVAPT